MVMLNLPSRRSTGFITPLEAILPGNLAYSLPSEYYVASYVVYDKAKDDEKMKLWLKKAYSIAEKVSVGTYVADFDAKQRMTKVLNFEASLTLDYDRQGMDQMGCDSGEMGSK
jgi:hypothetical protein